MAEAEAVYRATAQRFPDDPVTYRGLAEVLKAQGRMADAEAVYRATLQRFAEDPVTHRGFGRGAEGAGPLGRGRSGVPRRRSGGFPTTR